MTKFKRWEMVKVRDEKCSWWMERIFLNTIKWAEYEFICVSQYDNTDFLNKKKFNVSHYKFIKKIEFVTMDLNWKEFEVDIDDLEKMWFKKLN